MTAPTEHEHEHRHHGPAAQAAAARAQREAETIGWIDGRPVPRTVLDARLAALRAGPNAGSLPVDGSREGRQLVRWTAQVLLTERLCAAEVTRRGLQTAPVAELDPLGAVQLGSITAAAWRSDPTVSTLFAATSGTTPTLLPPSQPPSSAPPSPPLPSPPAAPVRPRYRLSLASGADPESARAAGFASIGWSTLDDLPEELATAARAVPVGGTSEPLRSRGTWRRLRVDAADTDPQPTGSAPPTPSGARLRAFARLLDQLRARSLRLAPGFEHPADPAQPDHVHQH
ncbi:peptidylprolyl isomerase [Streptacidiphilus sp. EB129]|uniref:peptidylprolyl isomerase n=1 Tax=Streptacidiphilus sp. EB129 TaxID=3156262 RepID=UPI0035147EA3